MEPVIFGIFGYGFAYVIGALWRDMRGKSLGWGIAVFIAISISSPRVLDAIYIVFGVELDVNEFFLWYANLALIGVPLMTMIYRRIR
jgi:hypothetical protein